MRLFNKYVATVFSFIYTLLWYGVKKNLTWSALSYAEYKIENVARFIGNTNIYKSNVESRISAPMQRRWQAFLSVPLAMLSLFANMFLLDTSSVLQLLNGE